MKNQILFDKNSEDFVREALGLLKRESGDCAFGYVNDNGTVKELTTYTELLELEENE